MNLENIISNKINGIKKLIAPVILSGGIALSSLYNPAKAVEEYTSDDNTVALYHFNESSGGCCL